MKAMVLRQFGEPLEMVEVPMPEVGPEEALAKVAACGICGTDLKTAAGKSLGTILPLVMGHEPAGVVAAIGEKVANMTVGDDVAVSNCITCGVCEFCRSGEETQCIDMKGRPGRDVSGGFAEYMAIAARNLFPISPSIPLEQVAVLSDAIVTVWHAIRKRARVEAGQTAVVVGMGGLGIHTTQVTRICGARTIAVDVSAEKLEMAKRWGADEVIDASREDVVARVMELTGGQGAHAVLDFVGAPSVIETDFRCLRRLGVLTVVGYAPGKPFQVDSQQIVTHEKRIVGSRNGSKQDMAEIIQQVEWGKLVPIVTRRFRLEEANQALETLRRGQVVGRAVVVQD